MFNKISLFLLLLIGHWNTSLALVPEQGLWWNPSESGRGYGIEIQDNYIYITYYAYGPDGSSTFFTSGGTYDARTNLGVLYFGSFSNGQCFGCAYQGSPVGTNLGDARITFTSRMTGTLKLPSGLTIPIQRQLFFSGEPRANLYGTWHLTTGALGLYFGDMLWIKSPDNSTSGGFTGRVVDGSAQRILVGAPTNTGQIAILVDSSTNYYTFYLFDWSVNTWGGRSWTYLKSQQLSGSGLLFFGSRVLGKTYSEQASASSAPLKDEHSLRFDDETLNSLFELRSASEQSTESETGKLLLSDSVISDLEQLRNFADSLSSSLKTLSLSVPTN